MFSPRLLPGLAAAAGIALTLALGHWQLGRAGEKEALQQRYDTLRRDPPVFIGVPPARADELLMRRVEVTGEFDPRQTVFIDNRILNHRPGYHVATPLRIAGSNRHVLVKRGWVAATGDRTLPAVATPGGERRVTGIALPYSRRYFELSTRVAEGNVWQNLDFERLRQATGLDLLPFIVQEEGDAGDGLIREWPRPETGRNTHLAYAFQWYALSLAILATYLVIHVRRVRTA